MGIVLQDLVVASIKLLIYVDVFSEFSTMNTGYSLYNPGGSLNFDIPLSVIQANEEDEAAEDARLKEREARKLIPPS